MFQPETKIIKNYARVLVNFALNSGAGIRPGEVVFLHVPESAKPLLVELQKVVLESKAYPIIHYVPNDLERDFYNHSNQDQLSYFPSDYYKGMVKQAHHFLYILAKTKVNELEGIDPKDIMLHQSSLLPYRKWRTQKETQNKLTWTLGIYPTQAIAREAGLSLQDYWSQVIKASYLDQPDPIKTWQQAFTNLSDIKSELNNLDISSLNIKGDGTDLNIGLDKNRSWMGGSGRNIPSFELFISPDWRRTSGYAQFDFPLYVYGNVIKDIRLEFRDGRLVTAGSKVGNSVLFEMINTKNADKIGEFSLTDNRFSNIDRFMANTLFDENYGGKYGNFHIALGSAYKDSFPGDASKFTSRQWDSMGYNDSVIHTDIISTQNRTVTASLASGQSLVIYQNGRFIL